MQDDAGRVDHGNERWSEQGFDAFCDARFDRSTLERSGAGRIISQLFAQLGEYSAGRLGDHATTGLFGERGEVRAGENFVDGRDLAQASGLTMLQFRHRIDWWTHR